MNYLAGSRLISQNPRPLEEPQRRLSLYVRNRKLKEILGTTENMRLELLVVSLEISNLSLSLQLSRAIYGSMVYEPSRKQQGV